MDTNLIEPNEDVDIKDELPPRRIKDASSAWGICQALLQEDIVASQNRAIIDGQIDGKPPYNQCDLDEAGQSERININPKDAAAVEEQATRAYYDLLTSVDSFIMCDTKFGDSIQRPDWCKTICTEFTKTLRSWNLFNLRISNLQLQYVRHGVGVSFFEDEVTWKFRTAGLSDFKLRRNTPAAEDEMEIAMVQAPYTVTQLYGFIREDEEAAAEDGWDVKQVKELIRTNVNDLMKRTGQQQYQNWELLERQIKENDLYYGSGDQHIWVNHMWVKEYDGRITHIMVQQSEPGGTEFLYENRCRFENIHRAMTVFTYGIGDGTYHTIRGLGWKIFDQEQAYARLWNTTLDGAMGNSVTMLQPEQGANIDMMKVALSFNGPFAIIPGGYKVVDRTIPDFSRSVMPALFELKSQIRNNTTSYQGAPDPRSAEEMPVKNYAAFLNQESALTESALDLWYAPWKRLMVEIFRRMQDPNYGPEDPGYAEILDLKKRIKGRGVPLEAFYEAYDVEIVRAVGAGSKMARLAAFDQAIALGGSTDEEGRYNLVRDRNALILGQSQIDRYWRPTNLRGSSRFSQDQKNAEFENALFKTFNPAIVSPSDNHAIHCASHDGLVTAVMESVMAGGETPPEDLEFAYKFLSTAVPHFAEHTQFLGQDPARKEEAKYFNRQVQKAAATAGRVRDEMVASVQNQQKAMQAEQERAVQAEQARIAELEEKASKADSSDPKENAKLQKSILDHQFNLRMKEAEFLQKQKHVQAELAQKLTFKDMESALKLLELSKVNPYATE